MQRESDRTGAHFLRGASLWDLIEKRAAATPDALFSVDEDGSRASFAQFRDAALRCAAGLAARGVGEGTRVSWMLPTWFESMVLVAGLSRLGAVQNPILPIYRQREVGFIAAQSRPRLLFVPSTWRKFDYAAMAHEVAASNPGLEVVVVDRDVPSGDPSSLGAAPAPRDAASAPERWLFYTSGTTSDPKGARHTDHTLMAAARGMSAVLDLRADDRVAMVFPFTHVGGITWLFSGMMAGCSFIVVPVFDPATSVAVLAQNGVTQATAGTAFHQAYIAEQRKRRAQGKDALLFPDVRSFPGGGAPKPPQLHFDIKKEMGGAGIVSGYGMTECPILVMNSVHDPDDKLAYTEGRPCPPEVDVRIVKQDETLAGVGEEGEFRVKAPQLFKGYLDEALNAAAFDANGYFRTGDLGHLDADGYAVITGRLKDVIIRKGENISAKEIEDLLYKHPKVADVAVIGLPDASTGERCCAVVACKPGAPLTFDELKGFLREQGLMTQKIPEQLELIESVPRNATGKILKHELRERYAKQAR